MDETILKIEHLNISFSPIRKRVAPDRTSGNPGSGCGSEGRRNGSGGRIQRFGEKSFHPWSDGDFAL